MVHIETYENFTIKIGRNSEENDKIIKEGEQNDTWFHIKNNPSPHGIIHSDTKEEPTKDVIYKTAELVKSFSKYKDLSKITIIYTKLKNIKRTNILGSVIIKNKTKEVIV
jgi:predicted ribosome quality control (RQC) complex YloA/Tae2 family protein